jgi:hypothetical protein
MTLDVLKTGAKINKLSGTGMAIDQGGVNSNDYWTASWNL